MAVGRGLWMLAVLTALGACGQGGVFAPSAPPPDPTIDAAATADTGTRPQARPGGLSTQVARPPQNARTAEQFDTTTAEQRAEAASAPAEPAGERALGQTVASLGDPARPGFWLETPLVGAAAKGRVVYPGSGQSAQVDLIPIDGPKTAGSRLSLAAMRLIGAPLTDLPTVEVYAGG